MTVKTQIRIQQVARTDYRDDSHNSVALISAKNFAPHRTEVNRSMTTEGHKVTKQRPMVIKSLKTWDSRDGTYKT